MRAAIASYLLVVMRHHESGQGRYSSPQSQPISTQKPTFGKTRLKKSCAGTIMNEGSPFRRSARPNLRIRPLRRGPVKRPMCCQACNESVGGAFMGEKVEHILYSLLPLILIIFVSWFFSFLGSRVKKQTEQAPQRPTAGPSEDSVDVFLGNDEVVESPRPAQPFPGLPVPPAGSGPNLRQPQPTSPQLTPRPIEPKWWGA